MHTLETNVFPITNLAELTTRYRLCRIVGLHKDQSEYYQNCQQLQKLSYTLKRPAIVIERDGIPCFVVPEDISTLPAEYPLVRTIVQFKPLDEIFELDYTLRILVDDEICLRFLRFAIQTPLHNDARLWQPHAGHPFFERSPKRELRDVHQFTGFKVRPVVTPDGGLGLCVDPTNCYVSKHPLPAVLNREDFNRDWKGHHCIYHFGDSWYEIKVNALDDRNVSEYRFIASEKQHILRDYVLDRAEKPLSPELAYLPDNAAVVLYQNTLGKQHAAPAPLCYPVVGPDNIGQQHGNTLLPPYERHRLTRKFVQRYLQNLQFGATPIRLASRPVQIWK